MHYGNTYYDENTPPCIPGLHPAANEHHSIAMNLYSFYMVHNIT